MGRQASDDYHEWGGPIITPCGRKDSESQEKNEVVPHKASKAERQQLAVEASHHLTRRPSREDLIEAMSDKTPGRLAALLKQFKP